MTLPSSQNVLLLIAIIFLTSAGLPADEPATTVEPEEQQTESRYSYRDRHDPNGIGKFYMGREIAHVMGHQGIRWLERPEREEEERLSLLIEGLKLKPGMTVADIGAGSGVISVLLAEAVGPKGTVLAVDIQQEMLDALQAKCKLLGVNNVEGVLGTTKSPRLEEETVDLVVMVDVYHEFDLPFEMLNQIAKSLKKGGRVAFVEYRLEDPKVPIKLVHKMAAAQVKKEALVEEHGLEFVENYSKLPRQHVVIFKKK